MTERAKQIMKAYEAEDTYNFPKDGVAAALREVANQLQYHNFGEGVDMIVDAHSLYEVADELEHSNVWY